MTRIAASLLFLGFFCSLAHGQPGFGRRGGGSGPGSTGSASLERAGVKLGQSLPDVTVFDEAGNKFRVADTKGKHTVIVFGCLT